MFHLRREGPVFSDLGPGGSRLCCSKRVLGEGATLEMDLASGRKEAVPFQKELYLQVQVEEALDEG